MDWLGYLNVSYIRFVLEIKIAIDSLNYLEEEPRKTDSVIKHNVNCFPHWQ